MKTPFCRKEFYRHQRRMGVMQVIAFLILWYGTSELLLLLP